MALKRLKNSSLLSRLKLIQVKRSIAFYLFIQNLFCSAQIANYVTNGSFEERYTCTGFNSINLAKGWRSIDSSFFSGVYYYSVCNGFVPTDGTSYQQARTGESMAIGALLCEPPYCSVEANRGYPRNRLKARLKAGTTYCVKFYISLRDIDSYGVDGIGAYFDGDNLDTIKKIAVPLTYLNPQVANTNGNIITDTMNWVLISGTFVANGSEKHLVVGNFKSDANTAKTLINPTILPTIGADFLLDDVSCIPLNLSAFAGHDTTCIPGTTVYLGRPRDVGIDEACTWYKLPNMAVPIATAVAGLTVSPTQTSTYVVKQDICGVIKYDTVVVFKDGVGIENLEMLIEGLRLYPQPASEQITLSVENEKMYEGIKHLELYNNLGQLIREEDISFKTKIINLNVSDLCVGVYSIILRSTETDVIHKRLVINR